MAWAAHGVRDDDGATKLTGPVGDRLAIQFVGPVAGYGGCDWAGVVKQSLDGDPVAEFTFVDNCTSDTFDLTIIIEDTTGFTAGCRYYFDIRAVTGPVAPTTPLHGTIEPEAPVTPLP